MSTRIVSVALDKPMARLFAYEATAGLASEIVPGALVEVPFAGRSEIGCVTSLDAPADFVDATFKILPIKRRVSSEYALSPEIMSLCAWIADYYFCSLGEALRAAAVVGFSDVTTGLKPGLRRVAGWDAAAITSAQRRVAERLPESAVTFAAMANAAATTTAMLRKLLAAGVIEETEGEFAIDPIPPPDIRPTLTEEQRVCIDAVRASCEAHEFATYLLHGVTGSGKTEVYLRLIEHVLARGGSALCLVPEIALTPQTVTRFAARFQQEIGVFHSQMTKREKLILERKIASGKIRIAIGARSALFLPLQNLGLIVIDEEHETSYKQGETPRYHARDTALVRASKLRIPVVLGSATPSLESWENVERGKYRLLSLTVRPAGLKMPEIRLVAMGKAAAGAAGEDELLLFSGELRAAISQRLERGEQSLLFLNRRGFSNFLYCPACRWVARCTEDDIALTIHRRGLRHQPHAEEGEPELELFPKALPAHEASLKCHFCGTRSEYPRACPECGEADLLAVGSGTQRIEEALKRMYPQANILRLDQDTISSRRAFVAAWERMVSGEAQIILGTQMIAKGLHLSRVTLAGVILADVGLFIPDFRAEERTFGLLMQVAGRSGRTEMGEVLIQTYMPHHDAIQRAARLDYEGFVAAEMVRRRKLRFPPVERLIALTISDPDHLRAGQAARQLGGILRRVGHRRGCEGAAVLGPQAAPIERLAGRFRFRILLRAPAQKPAAYMLRLALGDKEWKLAASTRLTIDVDPMDLM